jgi:hypothetical protein
MTCDDEILGELYRSLKPTFVEGLIEAFNAMQPIDALPKENKEKIE